MFQSRVTVFSETFNTPAISSLFRPPKYLNSTTWLRRGSISARLFSASSKRINSSTLIGSDCRRFFQRDLLRATAAFCISMTTRVVDQNASHDLRRDREEMRTIGPVHVSLIDETDVSFVNQGGGLKCVTFSLAAHVAAREPVQFFVDQRIQLVECGLVSVAPLSEQLGDLMLSWWSSIVRRARHIWPMHSGIVK